MTKFGRTRDRFIGGACSFEDTAEQESRTLSVAQTDTRGEEIRAEWKRKAEERARLQKEKEQWLADWEQRWPKLCVDENPCEGEAQCTVDGYYRVKYDDQTAKVVNVKEADGGKRQKSYVYDHAELKQGRTCDCLGSRSGGVHPLDWDMDTRRVFGRAAGPASVLPKDRQCVQCPEKIHAPPNKNVLHWRHMNMKPNREVVPGDGSFTNSDFPYAIVMPTKKEHICRFAASDPELTVSITEDGKRWKFSPKSLVEVEARRSAFAEEIGAEEIQKPRRLIRKEDLREDDE